MKLYVYCFAESLDTWNGAEHGVSGAPVRLLKIENLAVVVSDCDVDAFPVTRENGLAHAAVVRSVLEQTTPLPVRFGTLVTEKQLREYMTAVKSAVETKLAQLRGCVEMGVKIMWDVSDAAQSCKVDRASPGTTFLDRKRREIHGDERSQARVEELAGWLREKVGGFVRGEQVKVRATEARMLVTVAHLIEAGNIQEYRERLAEAVKERPELHFMVSGPWPPYSFANIELEFQTQFRVS